MAGQNIGAAGGHPEKGAKTAYDIKDLHAAFREWSDDDVIPVLPDGSRLEQNATYIDLAAPHPKEFTATGNMMALWAGVGTCQRPMCHTSFGISLLGVRDIARTAIKTSD